MAVNRDRFDALTLDRPEPETVGGRPILDLAASLWEPDRYAAFRVCYQAMREVDDLIDARRSRPVAIEEAERQAIGREVSRRMLEDRGPVDPRLARLHDVRTRFRIPRWPWAHWTRSMLYDLEHDGFSSFLDYLRYAEGAAVAPGAIFVHLCGIRLVNGRYEAPAFDIRKAARPLAIFCYLVHVVRDFEPDQRQNLNYFPVRLLARHGLTRDDLRIIAEGGPVPPGFCGLLADYHRIAGRYADRARARLDEMATILAPPYLASVELVYGLYHQIYEKMCPRGQAFRSSDVRPSEGEIHGRIETILRDCSA